jgi:hypothetical protein
VVSSYGLQVGRCANPPTSSCGVTQRVTPATTVRHKMDVPRLDITVLPPSLIEMSPKERDELVTAISNLLLPLIAGAAVNRAA